MYAPEQMMGPMDQTLRGGRLFALLEQEGNLRTYPRGGLIYTQGEEADSFYYLKRGSVTIFLTSEQGTERILALREPGSVFGEAAFFDGLPRMSSARAARKTELAEVTRRQLFQYFRQEPSTAMELLRYMARTVRMLSGHVDTITFLNADQRIAQLLLELRQPGAGGAVVSVSQEELGNLAGVSRMTVSRTLRRFAAQGWIETRYRAMILRDPAALRRFARDPWGAGTED